MIKSPIWSTWANFKARINDVNVKEYALDILANNYTHSQIEIDDKWQTEYGDFTFDTKKFPNIANFITELNGLGFRTTLWVHPFANIVLEFFYSFFLILSNLLITKNLLLRNQRIFWFKHLTFSKSDRQMVNKIFNKLYL
jgi:alpha-glucosidase (family GH31 glycosyl hydrolase)